MHELQMLVSGAAAVGLLTAPNMAWLLYRFGDDVLIHQNLIVPGWDGELSPNGFITRVPHYCSEDDEGRQISEWATTVDAVRAFLDAEGKNATDKIDA
ncbi:MAG: CdiI N-terminal domain [Phycisphaerales bacterium]|nr:CdiI N-terminal domain [Phycisphaerales bacterium]